MHVFIRNTKIYFQQYKRSVAFLKKPIFKKAKKLQVNLLDNRGQKLKHFSARHKLMTKLCRALYKYETESKTCSDH